MARLQSDNLTLEIKFKPFEYQWVNYEIIFYWKDDIIINDSILKREGEFWGKRPYGTFMANDYERDRLIDTIRKVLDTNEPEYWEPLEPDAKIAIYPNIFFPFLKSHWTLIDETDEKVLQCENEKEDEKENEKEKEQEKHQDIEQDDLFTIIIFIDSYNFKECRAYTGGGISLHMIVKREDLKKFVIDLELEYNNLDDKRE